jgi:hypothetical protein
MDGGLFQGTPAYTALGKRTRSGFINMLLRLQAEILLGKLGKDVLLANMIRTP